MELQINSTPQYFIFHCAYLPYCEYCNDVGQYKTEWPRVFVEKQCIFRI